MDKRNQRQTPKKTPRPGIAADYTLLPGIPDEMKDAEGKIRPGWAELLAGFDELGPEGLSARFERADQYLRDAGVFYRKYDGAAGKERAWPLAHVPLIIDEKEVDMFVNALDATLAECRKFPGPMWEIGNNFVRHALRSKRSAESAPSVSA